RKMLKAQALINDLMTASHLDEMVADVNRFVREVYVETAPLEAQERQELIDRMDQFQFTYTMQKAVVLAIAPATLAAALTDQQLAALHGFIRSPAFARAFDLFRDFVKSATAYTKEDIQNAQRSFEEFDRKSKLREHASEEHEKAKAAWSALIDKWR